MEPFWAQKGTQNGSLFGSRKAPKPFGFLVFLQLSPPKRGPKKAPTSGPEMAPFWAKTDTNGPKHCISVVHKRVDFGTPGNLHKGLYKTF